MDATRDDRRRLLIGCAFIVFGAVGFSAKSILIKLAYAESEQIDAITLMTLRMSMALPFFLGVALWRRERGARVRRAGDWTALVLLGVIGYYLASLLDFKGLEFIPAGLERLILFLYPTIVVLMTAVLYRRPITRSQGWALLLSYAGIALVVTGNASSTASPDIIQGGILVFGSAVVFSVFLTGSGYYIPRFGSQRFTAYSMSVACVATIVHFLVSTPVEQLAVSNRVFGLALALAFVSTVVPAFLMNAGIRRIGSDRAAIIGTVGPVSTLALAYAVLDETLKVVQIIGSSLVLGGVLLATRTRRTPKE